MATLLPIAENAKKNYNKEKTVNLVGIQAIVFDAVLVTVLLLAARPEQSRILFTYRKAASHCLGSSSLLFSSCNGFAEPLSLSFFRRAGLVQSPKGLQVLTSEQEHDAFKRPATGKLVLQEDKAFACLSCFFPKKKGLEGFHNFSTRKLGNGFEYRRSSAAACEQTGQHIAKHGLAEGSSHKPSRLRFRQLSLQCSLKMQSTSTWSFFMILRRASTM